jgi:pyruvate/oxaloacetate carboxyltransferase/biotin carboxyl carrier protein
MKEKPMERKKLTFVDQTLRDAQQSLWGFMMRTDHITPIAEVMDKVGFKAVGTVGGNGFTIQARAHGEDPWDRIRQLSRLMPNTPLETSYMPHSLATFDIDTPRDVIALWIKRCVANGVKRFWCCDDQSDMEATRYFGEIVKNEGALNITTIGYNFSPFHDREHWVRTTRWIAEVKDVVDGIRIEDPFGAITPEQTRELLSTVFENCEGIPVEFHSHCTTGLAPFSYLEAIKAGVTTLHTAVAPLANGTSLPALESIVRNAKRLGFESDIDEEALNRVSDHFRRIAEKEGLPIGAPMEYDLFSVEHQVPGGMMTNLQRQLKEVGMEQLLPRVLEEIIQVRKDFGYPIMGTPYSQIVGAQALENVVSGDRYKNITDEAIKYVLGFYGVPAGPVDQNVKDKIASSARAKTLAQWKPEKRFKPLGEIRNELGPELSEDELLLKIMIPGGPRAASKPGDREKKPALSGGKTAPAVANFAEFPTEFEVDVDGDVFSVKITPKWDGAGLAAGSLEAAVSAKAAEPPPPGALPCGSAGLVLSIEVEVGASIQEGDLLAIIEAMKMRRQVNSPRSGVVKQIWAREGDIVKPEDVLVVLE